MKGFFFITIFLISFELFSQDAIVYMPAKTFVTIGSGAILHVNGNLILGSQNDTTVSFIQEDLSRVIVTDTAIVERGMLGCNCSWNYHYVSSPIGDGNRNSFKSKVYYYLENHGSIFMDYGWRAMAANTSLIPGNGFSVLQLTDTTLQFKAFDGDSINQGNYSVPISCSNVPAYLRYKGYNLIGNPYPSLIDWELVTIPANVRDEVYTLNSVNENYAVYKQGGLTINKGWRYIPPMQGFFVKVDNLNLTTNFNFSNSIRVHDTIGFWKKRQNLNYLKIIATQQDLYDETIIDFSDESQLIFESKDAYKLKSNSAGLPQIYTKSEDGIELCINSIPFPTVRQKIDLFFESNSAGSFRIKPSYENSDPFLEVFLEDRLEAKIMDFSQADSYQFQYNITDRKDRFVLHFSTDNHADPIFDENINLYFSDGKLFLSNQSSDSHIQLKLFDLTGRVLFQSTYNQIGMISIDQQLPNAVYIAKIQSKSLQKNFKLTNIQ